MPPTPLDDRYAATVRRIRQRVTAYLLTQFTTNQFRDADLERFVALAVPVVLAGQRQVGALTDAYLAQILGVKPSGAVTDYPRGVDPAEVYARPYVTVRTALSVGKRFADAKNEGVERLKDIAATDMQLAKTHTARRVFRSAGVQFYQRTLTGSKSCALCYLASTQRYRTGDLLPIHPGCDCGVSPIVGDFDRTSQLEATHEAVAERFGDSDRGGRAIDYRKVQIQDHGEMGPLLTVRGQHFTAI